MNKSWNICLLAVTLLVSTIAASAAETIRVALVEPLSGAIAGIGTWFVHHAQFAFDELNARGGVLGGTRIEVLQLDNKSSPQEALVALKQASDQGIRHIFGGSGSHIALALTDAIAKHNARDPANALLFLNYAGLAPELTNEKCQFWHFRFDAHVDMKLEALTRHVAAQKDLRKVYLINQDYAYGQSVRRVLKEMLARKRPDVQVVGDDLHALAKVKDFAPYAAKINASDAQAVLTGNWGADLALLVRAIDDLGLGVKFYTLNANFTGLPTAIGAAGADRVLNVSPWHANATDTKLEPYYLAYKRKYREEWNMLAMKNAVEMWARAVDAAKSTDPLKVAKALEGMHYDSGAGSMWMRPDDHQLMQPQCAYALTRVGGAVKLDLENTGLGFRTEARYEAEDSVMPTTCKMERP